MPTFQNFTGINNVLAPEELDASGLTMASNVDIDLAGRAWRRAGFGSPTAGRHANVWEAPSYTLATAGTGGDLVNVGTGAVLAAGLGHTPRVWYAALPGGRTAYTNGTAFGIVSADGSASAQWGVPLPASAGTAADGSGNLFPGDYQWGVTYQRLADGIEGGPTYSPGVVTVANGAVVLSSIPVLSGYKANVYLTTNNGGHRYYAGSTTNGSFSFTGYNKDLVRPCRTEYMLPPPAGATVIGFWRGRALVAVGNTLFASKPYSWHLFDLRKDFKQFSGNITLVHGTDSGIWVGTDKELAFLAGGAWDQLVRTVKMAVPVVLGSGARVPGEHLKAPGGRANGDCMVCIADGWLVAGTSDGSVVPMSVDTYRTAATEVSAAFRIVGGIPQYVAQVL